MKVFHITEMKIPHSVSELKNTPKHEKQYLKSQKSVGVLFWDQLCKLVVLELFVELAVTLFGLSAKFKFS